LDRIGSSKPARVTIHSVAAAAGVSKSTVSRILNESPPLSETDTARLVRAAAADLGYIRDVSAANLRLGRTMTVGVVLAHLTEAVRAIFYEEVAKICNQTGRFALVAVVDERPRSDRAAIDLLLRQGVDGLIITTAIEGDDLCDELAARKAPFVLALRTDGRSPSAVGDDELGGYLATRHLLDLGHRRIGMISGPPTISTANARVRGFRRAMAEAGLSVDPDRIAPSGFGFESGSDAALALMRVAEPPTALFAANDTTAIGAMAALARLGLSTPGDVSIVGYSDIPIARHLPVPLTTIHAPYDQIAADALDLLAAGPSLNGDHIRLSAPTLVVRQSTARLR